MSKRITIVMDDDIVKALHLRQAKEISKTGVSVSFSRVINSELQKIIR
ncbi:MAG: hypothetical protein ACE5RQ_05760 [Nitrosopumilus sp.]|jgi:hypothetical protein|uniref:Uncharacterized protein n=2 Tax=Candidatus Nitrosomaritimum aestuariumsis TaxID=3342354 RepID=A0AC60VZF5_9ARCH|nr:hypothetical protein [Nitrosopumilaceae archaeon]MBA4463185.1 hypothetical protein [Nitrosopumilaceae archaeon]